MNFEIVDHAARVPKMRPLSTLEGRADRMRTAAYAEVMARDAFVWAAERFNDAPSELTAAWLRLAREEQKHLDWLLRRMAALGQATDAVPVYGGLTTFLRSAPSAREFATRMAQAELRGQRAGERFHAAMATSDPESAALFGRIAREEAGHIALAAKFFG